MRNRECWPSRLSKLAGLLVVLTTSVNAPTVASASSSREPASQVKAVLQGLPMVFEENVGQTSSQVRFVARGAGYSLFLTDREAVLRLASDGASSDVLRMRIVGARTPKAVSGEERLPGVSNYFLGNDTASWRTSVRQYGRVRLAGVYDGIDLVYYGKNGQLEYDFVVAPGADPRRIQLAYEGVKTLRVDASGDLVLALGSGEVRHHAPLVYQTTPESTRAIKGRFVVRRGNRVSFEVAGYDRSKPLIIDPTLVYSSYLGGSGDDAATAIAVDAAGSVYLGGSTTSTDFPISSGSFQPSPGGSADVFVSKVNPAGSAIVYSTFLGGSNREQLADVTVDQAGYLYLTGTTNSTNFPTAGPPLSAGLKGTQDAFVVRLNPTGTALTYSTFLGGSDTDSAFGIAIDTTGSAYVTGVTLSTDFPVAGVPFQASKKGTVEDAFVTKLNPSGSALAYSTFLGGVNADYGHGIAVDGAGNAYVAGYTSSTDFPLAGTPFQASFHGSPTSLEGFVCKVNPAGSGLVYSSFLGGSSGERPYGLAIDATGNAYVTGDTSSTDFPTTSQAFQRVYGGGLGDCFVSKVNPTGTALAYSTFVGGSLRDLADGIAVDSSGRAFITGWTVSADFPTKNPVQALYGGGATYDVIVAGLSASGSALEFSTFFGGSALDAGSAIAIDSNGSLYVDGNTSSTNLPLAGSPLQWTYRGGPFDAFVLKISSVVPSTYRYWIPVASHAGGDKNSQWRTDLGALNLGSSRADLEFHLYSGGREYQSTGFVAAGQGIFTDIAGQLGVNGSGGLEIRSTLPIKVTSRTYNLNAATAECYPSGTLGQNLDGYTTDQGLATGQSAVLPQLTENAQYRTNIALTNTGTVAASVTVTLFDGAATQVGSYNVTIPPGEWKQQNKAFREKGGQTNLLRGYARVTVSSGSGVIAYASVVDNVTNDPTTVVMVR